MPNHTIKDPPTAEEIAQAIELLDIYAAAAIAEEKFPTTFVAGSSYVTDLHRAGTELSDHALAFHAWLCTNNDGDSLAYDAAEAACMLRDGMIPAVVEAGGYEWGLSRAFVDGYPSRTRGAGRFCGMTSACTTTAGRASRTSCPTAPTGS